MVLLFPIILRAFFSKLSFLLKICLGAVLNFVSLNSMDWVIVGGGGGVVWVGFNI